MDVRKRSSREVCPSELLGKYVRKYLCERLYKREVQGLHVSDIRMSKSFDVVNIKIAKYKDICRWV